MVPTSMMSRAGSALIAVGTVLALASWYTRPDDALAWMALLAMFAVLMAMLRLSPLAVRRVTTESAALRSVDQIRTAVVFAALMLSIPLALDLARSYGLVDEPDAARRWVGVLTGIFIATIGNAMPKHLPPLSSSCDGARQQAFHRLTGWTWALCGLATAIGWLVLPIDYATGATVVLMVTGLLTSVVLLVRLARRRDTPAHGLN